MRAELSDPEIAHQRRWATLLVLCVSLMVIGLDNTILNVALPTLAKPEELGGLGASGSDLQWIVDSYTLVFAGLLLTAGSLGDRFGRYRALTIGLLVFCTGSVASATASSSQALIATRALMGVGAALIMPATLSIMTNVFRDPRERARAIGIWAGVASTGIATGPLIGGALLTHFWWGSVFLVNVPVVCVALVGGFRYVPESKDPAEAGFDPIGSVLSIVGLGALLWAIIEGPEAGWGSASVLGGFAIGAVVLLVFLRWETWVDQPMLDLSFFRNPRFTAASGAIGLTFLGLFGTIFVLTQYLQSVLGFSPVEAGAIFMPHALVMMVFAPLAPRRVERFGSKGVITFGLIVVASGYVAMATLGGDSSAVQVIAATVLLGLGMAHVMPPATESIMGSLPRQKAGVGSAMNDTTRQVGGAVGVAVLGSILASRFRTGMSAELDGTVPRSVVSQVSGSIGEAMGAVRDLPAAAPFADQIVQAASSSFIGGMRVAMLAGAAVMVVAAAAVWRWLPARGLDYVEPTPLPVPPPVPPARDIISSGLGPVVGTPAEVAVDVVVGIENCHDR